MTAQNPNPSSLRTPKILLVRLREIGDVVFTTPAIRALHEHFPQGHLTYVVEPAAAPIIEGNPCLDDVLVAPRRRGVAGLLADLELGRRLRSCRFDIALDFHGGPRASLLTWLSGAPRRIGYDIGARGWLYTERVSRPRVLRPRHSVENQWDLLTPLGIPPPERARFPVEMSVDPRTSTHVSDRLQQAGVTGGDELIVMHVSAGNPFRRWPIASFAAVAASLVAGSTNRRVIVSSGPSEQDAARRVIAEARSTLPEADRHRIIACAEFSLAELRALFERASLYIGGDSGPLHIAATSRVPIVGLYGPTLPARSAPWRPSSARAESVEVSGLSCRPCDQQVCTPGDFRCLTTIQPRHVVDAAERVLAGEAQ